MQGLTKINMWVIVWMMWEVTLNIITIFNCKYQQKRVHNSTFSKKIKFVKKFNISIKTIPSSLAVHMHDKTSNA